MISAIFQGVNPVLPIIFILLALLLSLFIGWWSYSYLSEIGILKKWTLISLRSLALFLLILLLYNPFSIVEQIITESPVISIYLDNSESIRVQRGNYQGLESYRELISELESSFSDIYQLEFYRFDEQIEQNKEILAFGSSTNLQHVAQHIKENESGRVASVIVSDGIFTRGQNPVFTAQTIGIPIFTVPVGDTASVKDQLISDITYNNTTYTNTLNIISAEIEQMGYEGEQANVQLFRDNELIGTERINFPNNSSSHSVEFQEEITEPGFYDYELKIPSKDDEFTDQNNERSFTIEVIDDKIKIYSIAFEIHPDVGAIRRFVAADRQVELSIATQTFPNQFSGVHYSDLEEDPDLILLHGLPEPESESYEWIANKADIPLLFFNLPKTASILSQSSTDELTGYSINQIRSVLDIQIQPYADQILHPILEFDRLNTQRMPSLKTIQGNYNISGTFETLLAAEFERTPTNIPVVMVEDVTSRKRSSVNVFGWYRYPKSSSDDAQQFFDQFFTNLISWTSVDSEQQNLKLETVKNSYNENENVLIRGNLINERGEPEPAAFVEVRIIDDDSENGSRSFRMNHTGNGNYSADIGTLPEGLYTIEGIATKNDRDIGSDQIRVNIGQSSLEFVNTQLNEELLRQIAAITDAEYIENDNFNVLSESLSKKGLDQVQSYTETETTFLHQTIWWFVIVLLLLSAEWLLRRSVSLP